MSVCAAPLLTCVLCLCGCPAAVCCVVVLLQAVEAPALAVMVPLLVKGMRESTAIQRKSCVIITNMSKLVNKPLDAMDFLPK